MSNDFRDINFRDFSLRDLDFYEDELSLAEIEDDELVLKDYRLTLAEILYHLPDHPSLLQSFVWQHLDIAPKYPELNKFLGYWEDNIDGKLHSVRIDSTKLVSQAEIRVIEPNFYLH